MHQKLVHVTCFQCDGGRYREVYLAWHEGHTVTSFLCHLWASPALLDMPGMGMEDRELLSDF